MLSPESTSFNCNFFDPEIDLYASSNCEEIFIYFPALLMIPYVSFDGVILMNFLMTKIMKKRGELT